MDLESQVRISPHVKVTEVLACHEDISGGKQSSISLLSSYLAGDRHNFGSTALSL